MSVKEYKISVPDSVIEDLHRRLSDIRWPSAIPGAGWRYGIDYDYLKEFCAYWRDEYDWRACERALNEYPSFIANIDGVDIRFWHVKGKGEAPFPLLLIHGWPGSSYEFFETIGPLTDPVSYGGKSEDSFDVVVPDLPGFGFSGHPTEPGWGVDRMARALDKLMTEELGYAYYGSQGGDWGSMISSRIGTLFADHVKGIHLNFALLPIPMLDELSPEDMEACKKHADFDALEGAYHLIQETKCDAVTMAQSDSPAGLAAWIIEKFRIWSDCGGDLESVYTKDRLLTNLMFYWAPNSTASAARIYFESWHDPELNWGAPDPQIKAPTAVAHFPGDPFNRPKGWAERHYNLVRWTEMPRGGHFAAMEEPDLLVRDIREYYSGMR